MIIILGIFDLVAILLTISAVSFSAYSALAQIFLIILALKGIWSTLISGPTPFALLGVLDLITAIMSYLTIIYGVLPSFTTLLLFLLGIKSLSSFIT